MASLSQQQHTRDRTARPGHYYTNKMIFALLHGEEFPAFTTNFLPWQPHAWRLLPGGDFLFLFRKECFFSSQIFSFFLATFSEVTFSHRKKITMLPSLQRGFATATSSIHHTQLGHDDDGSGTPF
jgi:hypothetical protein